MAALGAMLLPVSAGEAQVNEAPAARQTAGGEPPPVLMRVAEFALKAFQKPLHPIVWDVAPGGGLGAGVGYTSPWHSPWTVRAEGVATHRRYWTTAVEVDFESGPTRVDAYARVRDMPQLSFYGIGDKSTVADRTNFSMRERVTGTVATVWVAPWVALGVRAEKNWANLGAGRSARFPSVETRFNANDVPGMAGRAEYGRYEASINVRVPAALGEALYQGARYRIAYAYFHDQLSDQFTFARLDVEAQQRFAMPIAQHRLTLHGWISAAEAEAGQDVPFYLQRTLGGKSFVRSVSDNVIGSDGSSGTLRGFRELRFRDHNLLLLQAEYRLPVWEFFDATVYVDAGKVARTRSELDFTGLRHNFGFSGSVMKGDRTVARADFAFGGGEGTRVLFTISRDVPK